MRRVQEEGETAREKICQTHGGATRIRIAHCALSIDMSVGTSTTAVRRMLASAYTLDTVQYPSRGGAGLARQTIVSAHAMHPERTRSRRLAQESK